MNESRFYKDYPQKYWQLKLLLKINALIHVKETIIFLNHEFE